METVNCNYFCTMNVEFQNSETEKFFTENYSGKQTFPEVVLQAFRRKINLTENALPQ